MNIVTLIENTSLRADLGAQHGISIYIEHNNKRILFDVGKNELFIENARRLGLDIGTVDYVVISHAHYDHAGGLKTFLENNCKAKVIISEVTLSEDYISIVGGTEHQIGIDKVIFEKYKDRFIFVKEDYNTIEDMLILNNIYKTEFLPKGNNSLYKKVGNEIYPDDFRHELVLVFKEEEGDIIFTGCSHSGITNMLNTYRKHFLNRSVKALIGGFHLMNPFTGELNEDEEVVKDLGEKILGYNIEKIFTGHCTGEDAYTILKKILGDNIKRFRAGLEINI